MEYMDYMINFNFHMDYNLLNDSFNVLNFFKSNYYHQFMKNTFLLFMHVFLNF